MNMNKLLMCMSAILLCGQLNAMDETSFEVPSWEDTLAAYEGKTEKVKSILEKTGEMYGINLSDQEGKTFLIWATIGGNKDTVKFLLDEGAYIDHYDAAERSALIWASMLGHDDVAELLINKGANIGRKDYPAGETALDKARKYKHTKIAELLLDAHSTAKCITWLGR